MAGQRLLGVPRRVRVIALCAVGAVLVGTAVWYVQDVQTPIGKRLAKLSRSLGLSHSAKLNDAQRQRLLDLLDREVIDANRDAARLAGWTELVAALPPDVTRAEAERVIAAATRDRRNPIAAVEETIRRVADVQAEVLSGVTSPGGGMDPEMVAPGFITKLCEQGEPGDDAVANAVAYFEHLDVGDVWEALDSSASSTGAFNGFRFASRPGANGAGSRLYDWGRAAVLVEHCCAGLRLSLLQETSDRPVVWVRRLLLLRRAAESDGLLRGLNSANAIERHLARTLAAHSVSGRWVAEDLSQLARLLEDARSVRVDHMPVTAARDARLLALLNRLHSNTWDESGQPWFDKIDEAREALARSAATPDPNEDAQWAAGRELARTWPALPELRDVGTLAEALMIGSVVPIIKRASDTALNPTRLILAIELHRATHNGQLPATLGELVPGILKELPSEPIGAPGRAAVAAPGPNGDWGYRVLAEPDAFGRRYLLYSFGPDLTDDGGRMADAFDGNGLREPDPRFSNARREPDHVFNRPRPNP